MKLTLFRFNCRLTVGAVSLCSSGLAQLCNQEVCSTSHDVHFRRGPRESGSRSVGTLKMILCLQSPNRSQALSNITSQFIEARFWERLSKQNPPFAWKFFTNHTHDQWTPQDTVRFAVRIHLSSSLIISPSLRMVLFSRAAFGHCFGSQYHVAVRRCLGTP